MGTRTCRPVPLDARGLVDREEILRVDGAVPKDPAVHRWLNEPSALRALAATWFKRMRACGDDVIELFHDGCPVAAIGDAPFAYVNAFKAHVNIGFFQGHCLPDPAGLLEGGGKRMRHVKLRPGEPIDEAALDLLIAKAYDQMRERLKAEPASGSFPKT